MTEIPWVQIFLDVPRATWQESLGFWSAATGWTASPTRGEAGQFATLQPSHGRGWVKLQAVDGPPRVHVDLDAPDRAAAQRRSSSLGAAHEWTYEGVPVMRSPGGLLFCHTVEPAGTLDRSDPLRALDQVCIDIPADLWEGEVAFWRDLTGRDLTKGGETEFSFLGAEGAVRILLQRLEEPSGQVRAHVDFAVADREQEADRHVALGAKVVAAHRWWTVLEAPDGQVYCLTDRDPVTGGVRRKA